MRPEIKPSISLTVSGNWQELETMITERRMPAILAGCLKQLIACEKHSMITPEATPQLIQLVKTHLPDGIMLADSAEERLYDVVVFVPDQGKAESTRSFFNLIPKYPGGEFKYPKYL